MASTDGSVVIDVDMNVGDAEKRLAKLRSDIKKTENDIQDMASKRDKAIQTKETTSSSLKEAQEKLKALKDELANLQESKIAGDNLEKAKANAAKIAEEITKFQNNVASAESISRNQGGVLDAEKRKLQSMSTAAGYTREDISDQKKRVALLEAEWRKTENSVEKYKQKINESSVSFANQLKEIEEMEASGAAPVDPAAMEAAKASITEQQQKVKQLQSEWNKTENAIDSYNQKIDDANQKLSNMQTEAGTITQAIDNANKSQGLFKRSTDASGEAMERLVNRVRGLATRVFVFSVITRAFRAILQVTTKYIKANDEARQAIAQLKGALLTLAQPILSVIIPAFTLLVNILTRIISAVARFVSLLFGKSLKQTKDSAKAMYEEANAIDAVGGAAEDASGSLAGFDEINTINTEDKSSGAGGLTGSEIEPDFDSTINKFKGIIDDLMVYLSGALLVIGAILLFSGANIPLGLGLMVLGAMILAQEIAENWGEIDGKINDAVKRVFIILGGALLVIGAILCFSGANIPLGIGLMILGAAMAWSAAKLDWGSTGEELRNALSSLLQIIGPLIAVIGVLLAVTGHILLGIGLIIAGVAIFEAGKAAEEDGDFVQNIRSRLTEAMEIIGVFLSVVGVLLFVTGHILIGLALFIAGVALFKYSEVSDDSSMSMKEKITTTLKETLAAVSPMIAIAGLLLIVTGHILIGLALFIAGVALFKYSEVSDDSSMSMKEKITTTLKETLAAVSPMIAIAGLLLIVTGHILLGIALLIAGVAIFEYTKVSDDNGMTLKEKIMTVLRNTLKIASTFLLVLGLILLFIPAMWPTAIALIAAGAVGLVTAKALESDAMKNKLKEMWQSIKNWWNSGDGPKKFLTLEYWTGLGKDIIDWFLGGLKNAWDGLTSWFNGVWDSLFGNRKVSVDVAGASSAGNYNSGSRMTTRSIPEIAPQNIPALARGAVIPPNREFMAVLGDQTSGYNYEVPDAKLRQLIREETGGYTDLLRQILQAIKDGHEITVDGVTFGRTSIRSINKANRMAGTQLLEL